MLAQLMVDEINEDQDDIRIDGYFRTRMIALSSADMFVYAVAVPA